MEQNEFNKAMAELEGLRLASDTHYYSNVGLGQVERIPNYYNDLNQLMPLAWKHDLLRCDFRDFGITFSMDEPFYTNEKTFNQFLNMLRLDLIAIYREQTK